MKELVGEEVYSALKACSPDTSYLSDIFADMFPLKINGAQELYRALNTFLYLNYQC